MQSHSVCITDMANALLRSHTDKHTRDVNIYIYPFLQPQKHNILRAKVAPLSYLAVFSGVCEPREPLTTPRHLRCERIFGVS